MSIDEAILRIAKQKGQGGILSLGVLAPKVCTLRGRYTTDGSVSRIMRYWNEGKYTASRSMILRFSVIRGGLYRIDTIKPLRRAAARGRR